MSSSGYMNSEIYRAAREGDVDVLTQHQEGELVTQLTPNKNTVLHVAALFGQILCVSAILPKCPSLLTKVNTKGDTPLHLSVREDHSEVVDQLIVYAKTATFPTGFDVENGVSVLEWMLGATNEDGDTALHLAVRNGSQYAVDLLIKNDTGVIYLPNEADETSLYLAAENRLVECVPDILENCTLPLPSAAIGPNGRTALHAAVIFNSQENVEALWNWNRTVYKKDVYGWTPLHYAARLGLVERVDQLLSLDNSLAYIPAEEDENKTALHVAASQGKIAVMEIIKLHSPDCFDMINSKGQNIIHVAIESEKFRVIEFYLKINDPLSNNLINQKDNDGNTPLHLLAASSGQRHWSKLISHKEVEKLVFNKQGRTPLDTFEENEAFPSDRPMLWMNRIFREHCANGHWNLISRDKKMIRRKEEAEKKDGEKEDKERASTNLIVATLIATVTFAAGFTLPGGYNGSNDPEQGMAVMAKRWAFQAFVISDAIALMCSSSAVFLYVVLEKDGLNIFTLELSSLNKAANFLLVCAQGTMMFAFLAGIFVVLSHSLGIEIAICIIGCYSIATYLITLYATYFM